MSWYKLIISSPIDAMAARVANQKNCLDDSPLSKNEVAFITTRLQRKSGLLKLVLGICKRSQHANFIKKQKRGIITVRGSREPRAAKEYQRVCEELTRFQFILAEMNKIKKEKRA